MVRDKVLGGAVERAQPDPYTLRCPLCDEQLWFYAAAEPLDLGLLREEAGPFPGRHP